MATRHNGNGGRPRGSVNEIPRAKGTLIVIGGHEEKKGEALILRSVAERAKGGTLVVATLASCEPQETWQDYRKAFGALGVKHLAHLDVPSREELLRKPQLDVLRDASVIFFTGGGQLRITTIFGGTPLCSRIQEFYRRGGTIAGTSAGASAMSDTMLVSGDADSSHRIGNALLMAPGLGYLKDVIIDQHFAERGRIGRLLGAVAQNPKHMGVGLDENTAIIVEKEKRMEVLGAGAAYVIDGRTVTCTNITDEDEDRAMSIFNVRLHVLSQGDEFDLDVREPIAKSASKIERQLLGIPA
jgi:cyanophycinase